MRIDRVGAPQHPLAGRLELVQALQQVLGDATRPADAEPPRIDERGPGVSAGHEVPCALLPESTHSSVSIDRSHVYSADFASAARLIDGEQVGRVVQAGDHGRELFRRARGDEHARSYRRR